MFGVALFLFWNLNYKNDQKLPKWNRRARMGQILGFSEEHSLLVGTVRNLTTGYISPQFHLVYDDLYETVIRTKDDEHEFNTICDDLFKFNRDWYAEEEFDDDGKLIYRPPPLEDVWLDEQGRRERREQLGYQRRCRQDKIREKSRAVPDIIHLNSKDNDVTPFTGAPISDDESSDDDSLLDDNPPTESEGDNVTFVDDDGPPDTPPPAPNISTNSPEGDPSQPTTLITSPEGDASREGAQRRKKYPKAVWERGSDGKLRRVDLSKVNRQLYALTFGPHTTPPMAKKLSKKRMRLNYKKYRRHLRVEGDRTLQSSRPLDEQCPTITELMASPLAKYITLAANDCGYGGTAEELIVNYVHPLFLKAKSAASREDNPNWREATNGPFADDYWKVLDSGTYVS